MRNYTFPNAGWIAIALLASLLAGALPSVGLAQEPTPQPFECNQDAFIIQGTGGSPATSWLSRVDQSVSPFTFTQLGSNKTYRINNLGFRSTDRLLYGYRIDLVTAANAELLKIDTNGTVFPLGLPTGLPAGNLNAGDVNPDGTIMYLSNSGGYDTDQRATVTEYKLYKVTLPGLVVSSVPISPNQAGRVNDLAVHPTNGMLYGGDQNHGQLAMIDPSTGARTDVALPGLPGALDNSLQYGAAWFNSAGRLFLYENGGTIYEVDLGLDPNNPLDVTGTPTIISIQSGTGSTDNDGAACVGAPVSGTPLLTVEKTVTTETGSAPGVEELEITSGDTVKYLYEVKNIATFGTIFDVTLTDDNGTPGDPGDDFPITLTGLTDEIEPPSTTTGDGLADDLAAGAIATGEALVTISGSGTVINTATATGTDASGAPRTDSDTATVIIAAATTGTLSGHLYLDSNGNGVQDEGEPNLANVDVIVTDSLGSTQTVATDANGDWTATGLAPGDATADVDENDAEYPTGYTQTEGDDATTTTVVAGADTDGGTDGYYLPATVEVNKTSSGVQAAGFTFEIREGASTTAEGTVIATGTTDASGSTNFGGIELVPGNTYQLCETGMMPAWSNTLTGFTPLGATAEGGDNSTECVDFTPSAGETVVFNVNNVPPPDGDARTIGFWKNWSSCDGKGNQAPVLDETLQAAGGTILLGGFAVSTCQVAVDLLDKRDIDDPALVADGKKKAGDAAYGLAAQLLAAKLNVAATAGTCTALIDAIADADALLLDEGFDGTGNYLKGGKSATATELASVLDDYNNNLLCTP